MIISIGLYMEDGVQALIGLAQRRQESVSATGSGYAVALEQTEIIISVDASSWMHVWVYQLIFLD